MNVECIIAMIHYFNVSSYKSRRLKGIAKLEGLQKTWFYFNESWRVGTIFGVISCRNQNIFVFFSADFPSRFRLGFERKCFTWKMIQPGSEKVRCRSSCGSDLQTQLFSRRSSPFVLALLKNRNIIKCIGCMQICLHVYDETFLHFFLRKWEIFTF